MKNGKRRDAIAELPQMSADLSKHTYLWTLFRPHCEPTTGLGNLRELNGWLDRQCLPGVMPSEWIVDVCLEAIGNDHLEYAHDAVAQRWKLSITSLSHLRSASSK